MKSINNYKTFLITLLLVLGTVSQAVKAQNVGWRYATVLPGSEIKATLRPVFSDCYTVETYFQKDWFNCKDTKGLNKMNWNTIWNKVHEDANFTISKPGYLYIRFDSKIPKEVFYYGKPTIAISKMGKDKKWHNIGLSGNVFSPIQKQQYRISPDGTLRYYGTPAHYEVGQYKVTVVSATRNNRNRAERVFVPSSANAKVYFVADGSKVAINSIATKPYGSKVGYIQAIMISGGGSLIDGTTGKKFKKNDPIYVDQTIYAPEGVMAKVILTAYKDKPILILRPNTKIQFLKPQQKDQSVLKKLSLFFGRLFFRGDGEDHKGIHLLTVNAILGCEGTQFEMAYNPSTQMTSISVLEGLVTMTCKKGNLPKTYIKAGQKGMLYAGCNNVVRPLTDTELAKLYANYKGYLKPNTTNNNAHSAFQNALGKPCGTDKAFIRSLYQSILDRDMEDVSFKIGHGGGYLQNLRNGDSRWKVIYAFFNSPEYKNKHKSHTAFIRDAYQAVLGREPSINEIKAWPKINRNTILIKFFNLEAYRKIKKDCSNHKKVINIASLSGKWKWFTNVIVTIYPDGTVKGSNGGKGILVQNTNSTEYDYVINWSNGQYIDKLNLIDNTLKGKNQNGTVVWATRINSISKTNFIKTNQPWIIGFDNNAYYGTKSGWNKLPDIGIGKDIAVGKNGKIWLIGNDNRIYYYNGSKWVTYPEGRAIAISVSLDGTPWIIGTDNHIYYGNGSGWVEKSGGMGKDIAVDGRGRPWIIGTDNGIWYHNGTRWVEYPGGGRGLAISVTRDGTPWVIGQYNHIHHGTGLGWVELPGGGIGKDIAIDANGQPWVIGSDNGIYYYNGTKWVEHSGRGKGYRISVMQSATKTISHPIYKNKENIWALNSDNFIYKWNGGNWDHFTGTAQDIGVGANGAVWITGTENHTYGGNIYRLEGSNFVKTSGQGVRIDVDPYGNPWGINNLGHIYKWQNNAWHRMPGLAKDIGIGANGAVWIIGADVINNNHGIYKWTGTQWVKVSGAAVRIDVAPDGTPWVVNAAGDIFKFNNNSWHQLPGKATDISVGADGTAWIIGTDSVAGGHSIFKWNGYKWVHIPGGATVISVGGK